ncbi:prepilin-type N-terminal cleavage/methylation domain-containing protein [Legionella israelensis]|uniref:Prepilin-type N-terminal cleavage/methylation domain-containing protein n=1 Tax=Legionella israelensis TaxID=454 RepID=A0A0W0VY68_9GAMM|nr:prepilin-type N-terminal cleavage/methylation domain-containing protein [Legionella israelensis]KTD25052.1 hypothetical protein Lisr_1277 [Legionella israelensis]QBR84574.1 prepilin-type N-terminal cleavage/methylation domain-containing protein [Legionella israelensis]QBS10618.1 prepilin-type N-terminal cleavage/methylation domain-containing protein [Legionella israelensis]QDP72306.1 prepilin-type N-terminal cleavage/methylation domain-containing protein [Legionella israelensis]SCY18865.1 p
MERQKGFSLIEVLVSLILLTTTVLALLQQQWHSHRLLNQLSLQSGALQMLDNASEYCLSGFNRLPSKEQSFILKSTRLNDAVQLDVQWPGDGNSPSSLVRHLKRVVIS